MRTDAKIGFAIGGVLLAVLTVYAIVVPKHKKTTGTVALVKPDASTGADMPAPGPMLGTDGTSAGQPPVGPLKDTPVPQHVDPVRTDPVHNDSVHNDQVHNNLPHGDIHGDSNGDLSTGPLIDGGHGHDIAMGGGISTGPDLTRRDDRKPTDVVRPGPSDRAKSHVTKPIPPFEVADNSAASDRLYTIQSGQTLSKIAYEVYGNARFYVAIQRENRGLDPNHLKVGSQIKLPEISPVPSDTVVVSDDRVVDRSTDRVVSQPDRIRTGSHPSVSTDGRTYIVQLGDNLYAIARKMLGSGRRSDQIYDLNKVLIGPDKARLKLGMVLKLPA